MGRKGSRRVGMDRTGCRRAGMAMKGSRGLQGDRKPPKPAVPVGFTPVPSPQPPLQAAPATSSRPTPSFLSPPSGGVCVLC